MQVHAGYFLHGTLLILLMVIQMRNLDPASAESGSGLCIWITIWIQIQIFKKKQISKKNFFLIFTFPYVTIMKI